MTVNELKTKIDGIWDIMWSAGMGNSLTIIEQITYLMFIKILDDNELKKESIAATFGTAVVDPLFNASQQNCRWSVFKHYDADTMFSNMTSNVFPFIKNELHSGKDTAYARFLKDAIFQLPTARTLARVIDALDDLDMTNKDVMGDVYEHMLSKLSQAGKAGEFRTPRHIINMMVDIMEPTLEDTICDPAMGSAGFITAAARYVSEHYSKELLKLDNKKHYTTTMFTGFDTDQTMLRIGAMNMMLHDVDAPNIAYQDSLSEDNKIRDEFSLILANPPFAGSLDKSSISKDLLTLASTTKTELLFVGLFTKMLRIGGRCASIVPDGVLFGSSKAHKDIRKELVENQRLVAVISMPSGVFQPYAGVKTSILVFTKTDNGGTDNVWFYDMTNDGYTLDVKRSPIEGSDIPDIVERFHHLDQETSRTRKDKSFLVPKEDIVANEYDLTINKYKEIEKEVKVYRSTEEILADIDRLEQEYAECMKALKEMLK